MKRQQNLLKLDGCSCTIWTRSDRFSVLLRLTRSVPELSGVSWTDLPKDNSWQVSRQGLQCRQLLEILRHMMTFQAWGEGNPHNTVPSYLLSVLSSPVWALIPLPLYLFLISIFTPLQWCLAQLSVIFLPTYPHNQRPPAFNSDQI